MSAIALLWMPILITAVLIFIASTLIHMVFKWHNSDYQQLANEDDVRAVVHASSAAPGQYMIPHCVDMKEMGGEVMMKKFNDGPVAFLTVRKNGAPAMGPTLMMWFVFTVGVAAFAGWIAMSAYAGKTDARAAGQMVGLISFMAYGCGSVPLGIWMGKPWSSVGKDLLDALIYGVISWLAFAWFWPS
jgi:hypothetical protein